MKKNKRNQRKTEKAYAHVEIVVASILVKFVLFENRFST